MPRLNQRPRIGRSAPTRERIHTTVEEMILALQDVTDDDDILVAAASNLLVRARRRPHLVRQTAA